MTGYTTPTPLESATAPRDVKLLSYLTERAAGLANFLVSLAVVPNASNRATLERAVTDEVAALRALASRASTELATHGDAQRQASEALATAYSLAELVLMRLGARGESPALPLDEVLRPYTHKIRTERAEREAAAERQRRVDDAVANHNANDEAYRQGVTGRELAAELAASTSAKDEDAEGTAPCAEPGCGRDNDHGTHDALERAGHLRHGYTTNEPASSGG